MEHYILNKLNNAPITSKKDLVEIFYKFRDKIGQYPQTNSHKLQREVKEKATIIRSLNERNQDLTNQDRNDKYQNNIHILLDDITQEKIVNIIKKISAPSPDGIPQKEVHPFYKILT